MTKQIFRKQSLVHKTQPRGRLARNDNAKRHPSGRFWRGMLATAQGIWLAYQQRLRFQRDEEILRQMSRHELNDIGLDRLPDGHFGPLVPDPWPNSRPR